MQSELFWGYATAGLGALIFLGHCHTAVQAKRSRSWPRVLGKILPFMGIANPETEVRYAYEVAGIRYESRRITLGLRSYGRGELSRRLRREIRENYRPGQEVEVYYNPRKPSSSILELGLDRFASNITVIVGLGFLASGLYFIGRSG